PPRAAGRGGGRTVAARGARRAARTHRANVGGRRGPGAGRGGGRALAGSRPPGRGTSGPESRGPGPAGGVGVRPGRGAGAARGRAASDWCHAEPGAVAGMDGPRLYVGAIHALFVSGDSEHARLLAEEAYRRFAGHVDPATAAVVRHRAAFFRANDPAGARLLM